RSLHIFCQDRAKVGTTVETKGQAKGLPDGSGRPIWLKLPEQLVMNAPKPAVAEYANDVSALGAGDHMRHDGIGIRQVSAFLAQSPEVLHQLRGVEAVGRSKLLDPCHLRDHDGV